MNANEKGNHTMKEQAKSGNKVIGYVLLAVMAVSFLYFGVYKVATGQAQMDVQTAFLNGTNM